MIATMSKREKAMAAIVVGAVFLLFNIAVARFFMRENAVLKRELKMANSKIERNQEREAERLLWEQRGKWLDETMQPMGDPQQANKQLRDTLVELGKKHGVVVQPPTWGNPKQQPFYTVSSMSVDVRGSWMNIFNFLHELQSPGQFVVFESAKLEVDKDDKTQMKTSFAVAKWYAAEAIVP